MSWEVTIPLWKLWISTSLIFFAGYAVASILFVSAGRRDAKVLGDMGRTLQRKHDEGVFQDPDTPDQTLVVGEILERKRTPSGRVKKNPKGNKAEV